MQLTAIFESWHIGDGNYPPLSRAQLVRLTFELQPRTLVVTANSAAACQHRGNAEYSGRGQILRSYAEGGETIAVIEADWLRFYVHGPRAEGVKPGAWCEFDGTLFLDHYLWVEYLAGYANPPDLFYNLRVARIRRVGIPERFVHRQGNATSYPTHVGPKEFGLVEDLETMEGQDFSAEFYVIDFDGAGLDEVQIPRTFQG